MKISVVIPTMNEEKTLGKTLDAIPSAKGIVYEKMIVDTNSKDKTREIAKKKGCKIISEPRKGYGRAYKTGLKKATGDFIVCFDADGTYPVEDIPKIAKIMEDENLDFITCSRFPKLEPDSMPALNRFGNWGLTLACNILFGTRFMDTQSGMWMIRKKLLPKLVLKEDGMELSTEIKLEGVKSKNWKEIPIVYRKRDGETKQRISNGVKILKFMLRRRFSKK